MPWDWKSSGILRPRVDETLGATIFLRIDSKRYGYQLSSALSMRHWVSLYCFKLFDEALGSILVCLVGSVYLPKSGFVNKVVEIKGPGLASRSIPTLETIW
ncbi:hypothetical protein J1N35_007761 [Gossypium stocksii]|uniref:Uncharacterized protein n=1 Tax=Gossypium stocksii TaxID=47602 RepID=A0A9D3W820_9ROSI|nr:hypothetical protein J1N35_007761 [Gossypium stocksii]